MNFIRNFVGGDNNQQQQQQNNGNPPPSNPHYVQSNGEVNQMDTSAPAGNNNNNSILPNFMQNAPQTFLLEVTQLKERLAYEAERWKEEKKLLIQQFAEEKANLLRNALQTKLEALFDFGMEAVATQVKEAIKDPYMPLCVQNIVDGTVDAVLPDVKIEIKDAILQGLMGDHTITSHGEPPCCCAGQILAAFRYWLCPYDRSIWRLMRNPLWWIYNILSLVPKYSLSAIMYILWFLMIDKSDEFQLFTFIANFKSLQFITLGVVSSFVGSVQYYLCTTTNTCQLYSPREDLWTVAIFAVQIIVVYLAFLLMQCSHKKGGFYYQADDASKRYMECETGSVQARKEALSRIMTSNSLLTPPPGTPATNDSAVAMQAERLGYAMRFKSEGELLGETRGRLFWFFIYDLFVFILCVGLGLWMAFLNLLDPTSSVKVGDYASIDNSNWKFVSCLFWIKALYGVLSFPFVLLQLPLFSAFICHARPTGYNPYGNTVPFRNKEETVPVPWDPYRHPAAPEYAA